MKRVPATLLCLVLIAPLAPRRRQQPAFRSRTDLVLVDAAVLSHGSIVKGLGASDFELLDDGVPQAPQLVQGEMPVDLTVLAEVTPLLADPHPFWADLAKAEQLLHPEDRIGLLTFTFLIHQDIAPAPPPIDVSREPLERGGEPRLFDALAQALMVPGSRVASHTLVVYTDGVDVRSTLTSATVLNLCERSDARVLIVLGDVAKKAVPPWGRPKPDPVLKKLADSTDGRIIKPGQLASTLTSMLAELRQSYLFGFVPKGVDAKGWHTITVKVTKPGGEKYTVRARRGYFGG